MRTRTVVARQQDDLYSIAARHGTQADVLWRHPANRHLHAGGRSVSVLHSGDVVHVPVGTPEVFSIQEAETHQFVYRQASLSTQIELVYDDEPIANTLCLIEHALLESPQECRTNDAGVLTFNAPLSDSEVRVLIPSRGLAIRVQLGRLSPVATLLGQQMRLTLLDLYHGPHDGVDSPAFREALRRFQQAHSLPESDVANHKTRVALENAVGC